MVCDHSDRGNGKIGQAVRARERERVREEREREIGRRQRQRQRQRGEGRRDVFFFRLADKEKDMF